MKFKSLLLSTLLLLPTSALAQQRVYTESYVEEYIPGYYNVYGQYVAGYVRTNRRRIPCAYTSYQPTYVEPVYAQPRCNPARTTLGGLLGGGIAAAVSKKDAWSWAIPLGAVLGTGAANVNCY
jgi:hypothetical protein